MEIYKVRLVYKGVETILSDMNLPDGMESFDIQFVRSKTYHSVFNNFSLPIGFIGIGKEVVDEAYDADGVDAYVEIYVDIQNEESLEYENYIYGTLNFHGNKRLDDSTELQIIDGSKKAKFIARDEIKYNLKSNISTDNVTVPDFINMPRSIDFTEITPVLWAEFDVSMSLIFGGISGLPFPIDTYNAYGHSGEVSNFLNTSINANPVINSNTVLADVDGEPIYTNLTDDSKEVRVTFDSIIQGSFSFGGGFTATVYGECAYIVRSYDSSDVLIEEQIVVTDNVVGNPAGNLYATGSIDKVFVVPENGYILGFAYLYYEQLTGGNLFVPFGTLSTSFSNYTIKEYRQTVPETSVECFMPFEAMTRLIQLATSETSNIKLLDSPILGRTDSEFVNYDSDGAYSLLAIVNGYNLRGQDKAINFSISDLFKTLDSLYNLGLWYNNITDKFEIKEKKEYYRDDVVLDLGEVETLETIVANDLYTNDILGGYDTDNQYSNINGALEFNGKSTYSTPSEEKYTLDIRSPFTADSIGINESIALRYFPEEGSDDNDNDNNIFIATLKRLRDRLVTRTGADFNYVSGIIDNEQYYNYDITPKRNLLRNSNRISPSFWKKEDKYVNSVSTRNDLDLETQLNVGDQIVKELSNEVVFPTIGQSNIDDPLYDNDYYILTAPIGSKEISQLLSDPHGKVRFTYRNIEYFGYVDNISSNSYTKKGNIKLIKSV